MLVCFYFVSCLGNKTKVNAVKITDSGVINQDYLELLDSAGFSFLKINGREIKGLYLKSPCFFIKSDGKIQHFAYPEAEVSNAIIIAGRMTGTETSTYPACGNATQGLLFKKDTVLLINKIFEQSFTCPNVSLDEKNFWAVAHYERDEYKYD